MDPTTAELIRTVSLEAIKVLGPAAIAGFAGYKAAAIQLKLKSEELKQSHRFEARRALFTDLKDRLARVEAEGEKFNRELGHTLGFAAGYHGENPGDAETPPLVLLGQMAESGVMTIRSEIRSTLREMQQEGLESSEEFHELQRLRDYEVKMDRYSLEEVRACLLELLRVHSLVARCMREVLGRRMRFAFAPYLE